MAKITIECCAGNEKYEGHCLKSRCTMYKRGQEEVRRWWPYVETVFGNLDGYPKHADYLVQVRESIEITNWLLSLGKSQKESQEENDDFPGGLAW